MLAVPKAYGSVPGMLQKHPIAPLLELRVKLWFLKKSGHFLSQHWALLSNSVYQDLWLELKPTNMRIKAEKKLLCMGRLL